MGVTCSVCTEITRINEQQANGGLVHKVWIKETQAKLLLFMSLPSHIGPCGWNTECDWHCNHRRVFWHQIQLFVNAEHSQEFIFMQRISSVTYSEYSGSEHTLGRRGASKHPNNYTCSHMTSGWFSLQATNSADKKIISLRVKTIQHIFIFPFICQQDLFHQLVCLIDLVWLSKAFYSHCWTMFLFCFLVSSICPLSKNNIFTVIVGATHINKKWEIFS